jgi:hypothetical protein
VYVATGVKVALVGREPALDLFVLYPYDLNTQIAWERARDPLAEDVGRYVNQARFSSAVPS